MGWSGVAWARQSAPALLGYQPLSTCQMPVRQTVRLGLNLLACKHDLIRVPVNFGSVPVNLGGPSVTRENCTAVGSW